MNNAMKLIKKYKNIITKPILNQHLRKLIITINNINIKLILRNFTIVVKKRFITKIFRVLLRRLPRLFLSSSKFKR